MEALGFARNYRRARLSSRGGLPTRDLGQQSDATPLPGIRRVATAPLGMTRRLSVAVLLLISAAVAGCTSPRGVPGGARLVTEATVKSSFQAPADGMLWIFRSPGRGSRGQLHYSGPVAAGQVLVIDPAMNRATIDGEPLELVLPGGDVWYQAYFKRDPAMRRVLANRPAGRAGTPRDSYDQGMPLENGAPARDTSPPPGGEQNNP